MLKMSSSKIAVHFHLEDLTGLQADMCVAAIGQDKKLKTGALTSAILRKAGPSIQLEIDNKVSSNLDRCQIVSTNSGSLTNFQRLLFIYLDHWESCYSEDLFKAVLLSLVHAAEAGFKTVAFPAMGMGRLGYPPYEVAVGMLKGVAYFASENPDTSITTVHIASTGLGEDTMWLFVQSALLFCRQVNDKVSEVGISKPLLRVQGSENLMEIKSAPTVKVKTTWEKIMSAFSSSQPLPSGELFLVEVTPTFDIGRDSRLERYDRAFKNAYNAVKLKYIS